MVHICVYQYSKRNLPASTPSAGPTNETGPALIGRVLVCVMCFGVASLIAWGAIYASGVEHIGLLVSDNGRGTSLLHTGCLAHDPVHKRSTIERSQRTSVPVCTQ